MFSLLESLLQLFPREWPTSENVMQIGDVISTSIAVVRCDGLPLLRVHSVLTQHRVNVFAVMTECDLRSVLQQRVEGVLRRILIIWRKKLIRVLIKFLWRSLCCIESLLNGTSVKAFDIGHQSLSSLRLHSRIIWLPYGCWWYHTSRNDHKNIKSFETQTTVESITNKTTTVLFIMRKNVWMFVRSDAH